MSGIWDAFDYRDVIRACPREPLPECNRGSWFCPVATKSDAQALDYLCRREGINKVYDLGAGTLKFATEMDRRGYEVVAYESIGALTDFAQERLPASDVEVRNQDYHSDWQDIRVEQAAFVALGKLNKVPGDTPNGISVDGMTVAHSPNA